MTADNRPLLRIHGNDPDVHAARHWPETDASPTYLWLVASGHCSMPIQTLHVTKEDAFKEAVSLQPSRLVKERLKEAKAMHSWRGYRAVKKIADNRYADPERFLRLLYPNRTYFSKGSTTIKWVFEGDNSAAASAAVIRIERMEDPR